MNELIGLILIIGGGIAIIGLLVDLLVSELTLGSGLLSSYKASINIRNRKIKCSRLIPFKRAKKYDYVITDGLLFSSSDPLLSRDEYVFGVYCKIDLELGKEGYIKLKLPNRHLPSMGMMVTNYVLEESEYE